MGTPRAQREGLIPRAPLKRLSLDWQQRVGTSLQAGKQFSRLWTEAGTDQRWDGCFGVYFCPLLTPAPSQVVEKAGGL